MGGRGWGGVSQGVGGYGLLPLWSLVCLFFFRPLFSGPQKLNSPILLEIFHSGIIWCVLSVVFVFVVVLCYMCLLFWFASLIVVILVYAIVIVLVIVLIGFCYVVIWCGVVFGFVVVVSVGLC